MRKSGLASILIAVIVTAIMAVVIVRILENYLNDIKTYESATTELKNLPTPNLQIPSPQDFE